MKKSLSKNIISFILCFFFILLNTFVFFTNGMNSSNPVQIKPRSPQNDEYAWYNPLKGYNEYKRKNNIDNGPGKTWFFGIPIGTHPSNNEYLKEFEETTLNNKKFKQCFNDENYSYLNELDKETTDFFNRRIGHLCSCIAWFCSRDTHFSNEERLHHLEYLWKNYQDLIPPIYVKKLNKEVIAIAELLNQQVQQVQNRFEGLEEYNLFSESITNDNSPTEE